MTRNAFKRVLVGLIIMAMVMQPVAPIVGSAAAATNTAPEASIEGPTAGGLHVSYTWTANATDAETDAANLTYRWDLNDDGTAEAAGQSVSKTFSEPGDYTISLTVEDSGGLTDTATINFTVAEDSGTQAPIEDYEEENAISRTMWAYERPNSEYPSISSIEETAADVREAMMYQNALDEEEDREAFMQIYDNYAHDAKALASQDAKYAIAQAYSNGSDLATAENASIEAIEERFARMQRVVIERLEARVSQLSYHRAIAEADDEIPGSETSEGMFYVYTDGAVPTFVSGTATQSTILANGTEVTYTTPEVRVQRSGYPDQYTQYGMPVLPDWNHETWGTESTGYFTHTEDWTDIETDWGYNIQISQDVSIRPSNTTKYPDRETFVSKDWREQFRKLNQSAQELVENYKNGTAETIYLALEDGEVEPSDIYSSETMLRKMSGDTEPENMSKYNLRMATLASLGLNNPNMTQTNKMVIEFSGVTLPQPKNVSDVHVVSENTTTTDILLESGYNTTAQNHLTTWGVFAHYEDGRKVRIPRDLWTIEDFSVYDIQAWESRPDGNLTNVSVEILDGSEYTDNLSTPYIEDTITGMVFSDNLPPSGEFSVNETYHTGNIEGMQSIVTLNGSVYDIKGQVTIEAMYSPDGTEVENVTWEEYDYGVESSDDFVNDTRYIEKIITETIEREEELASGGAGGGDTSDSSFNLNLPSFDLGELWGIPIWLIIVLVLAAVLIAGS